MKPANLLRWYPRAWRERYGEELLALIQDTLDEGRPTWRLRLSVIWGGLRERVHQSRNPSKAGVRRVRLISRWLTILLVGSIAALLPQVFTTSPPAARAGQATAAFVLLAAVAAFICTVLLAGGLAALPAVVRFLRAGGWPKIRRAIAWAVAATVPAAGGLAYMAVTSSSQTQAQQSTSLPVVLIVTWPALVVAIGLWASAVAATARHLTLTARVRAAELVLGSVIPAAVSALFSADIIWYSAAQASVTWLIIGVANVVVLIACEPTRIGRAVRKGRRVRAAASGATIVNPSAQRTHGRHQL